MSEMDESLRSWAMQPGPARFLDRLRRKLERGGGVTGRLAIGQVPFTESECRSLRELFGLRSGAVSPNSMHLDRADRNLRSSRYQIGLLKLVELIHGPIVTAAERRDQEKRIRTETTAAWRQRLLDVMSPVPQLSEERRLFAALGATERHRVPVDSKTGTTAWKTYEAAIRAAAFWWPLWERGEKRPERTIAAEAFRGSKRWTVQSRIAFALLVNESFDDAVIPTDTDVRVKGPISWQVNGTAADGMHATPWVAVPARGIVDNGTIDCDAKGIFLIENKQTFQQVCAELAITRDWLCIWNQGFASDGLMRVIRYFEYLPVVAWCDLDPSGIKIIQDLQRKAQRQVHVVAMEPELWHRATKYRDKNDDDQQRRQQEARRLVETGPLELRQLAEAIATTGQLVEQEGEIFCSEVIPSLPQRLVRAIGQRA